MSRRRRARWVLRASAGEASRRASHRGQQPGLAVQYYKVFYAGESLSGAHAGFQSLNRYVIVEDDGTIGIVREPEDDPLSYGRLRTAVVLTSLLAKWRWGELDLTATPSTTLRASQARRSRQPLFVQHTHPTRELVAPRGPWQHRDGPTVRRHHD
jgi:hypothetical protein